jgi:hypothetical protein
MRKTGWDVSCLSEVVGPWQDRVKSATLQANGIVSCQFVLPDGSREQVRWRPVQGVSYALSDLGKLLWQDGISLSFLLPFCHYYPFTFCLSKSIQFIALQTYLVFSSY